MNFYKLAQPDGFDFYTSKTINYRENIGKVVKCPDYNKEGKLCSNAFIHASRDPHQCFVGAKMPCSAYLVSGKPIKEDDNKCGFKNLKVVEELNPEKLFKWRYKEACNPINPTKLHAPGINDKHIRLLNEWDLIKASVKDSVRASVWDLVRDSVRDSVWASVWASIWASVKDSVRASVWASVWDSVWDLVWAYIGYIFQPVVLEWQKEYPYQGAVDLWKEGFIPVFFGDKKYLWSKDRGLEKIKGG